MECNKEEAFRAREIAEKKMQNKDFIGAQKIAQRAQHLYPELENISQILTVCEVHCSADVKVNGLMDWYGILQVEPTADDLSIKKQYRKLALLLHPDKNQFPGAEAAFKLIGEAHMFLSDQSKRCIYDIRRDATKHVLSNQSAAQMGKSSVQRNFNAGQSSGVNQQLQQPSQFADSLTFWTACPDCSTRYQYYRSVLKKAILCPNCLKPFVAYDLNEISIPREVNLGQSVNNFGNVHQQVQAQKTNQSKQQRQCGIDSSSMGVKESVGGGPKIHFDHGGEPATVATNDKLGANKEVKFVKRNPGEMNQGELASKPPTANVNRKTGRKVAVEPRDSVSSGVKNITKEDGCQAKHSSTTTPTRRSGRLKQNNNHNEVRSENDNDDFIIPHKKLRESSSGNNSHEADANFVTSRPNSADVRMEDSHRGDPSQKTVPHGSEGANRDSIGENKQELVAGEKSERRSKSHVDSTSNSLPESQTFTYPDSEFGNFEESRHFKEFAVDQIWAVYDDLDGMPRFYARIRKIHVPHAKLRFTWLEHNPLNEAEIAWSDAKLPVCFGNYLLGSSHVNEDLLMFSHVIPWEKGKKRNSYVIYPRKGEVWALFKDWNVQWTSDAENRLFEYEVVEVLSDFKTETGICVTPLIRIEGFLSLFMQMKEKSYVIPPNEVLRFSHNIPSYRLTGTEKEGIPQGCMELDPASLPANFAESFPSISLENSFGKEFSRSCLNSTTVEEEPGIRRAQEMETEVSQNLPNDVKSVDDSAKHQASQKQHSDAWRNSQIDAEQAEVGISQKDYLDAMDTHGNATGNEKVSSLSTLSHLTSECPEAEFHNFDEGKSVENVQQGQVWALFTNIDKYPKYYAWVKEVNLEGFRVQMSWLEACPVFEEEMRWLQESMPIACGTFKVEQESMIVDKIGMFSHLVQPKIARRNRHVILPSCGEVWAVYKNWAAGWSYSDWENCEYDVVEICECADVAMKVRPLRKVNGYRAVFKPEMQGKSMTLEIPIDEYTRFSHKIPAFLLTNEVEGKLRGYWELDAASVPEILLLSNTA